MEQFKLYDLIAVVGPGAVLVISLSLLFPESARLLTNKDLSVGEFGMVLIASYLAGNLMAPISHLVQAAWFRCCGGNHTDRIPQKESKILHRAEIDALNAKLRAASILRMDEDVRGITLTHWRSVVRRMRAYLAAQGSLDRIEVFNAHYGLNRGLAAAFLILSIVVGSTQGLATSWRIILPLLGGMTLAIYRMNDFGYYYATELIRHFLNLTVKPQTQTNDKSEGD